MISSRQACEMEAIRSQLGYAVREFDGTLNLIEEDVAMLRETPNEVDIDRLFVHVRTLENEFSALQDLHSRVVCFETAAETV